MKRALGLIVIALLAVGAVFAFSVTLEASGTDHTVDNESWTPDAGSVTELDNSYRTGAHFSDDVIVRDENGTLASEGEDFSWDSVNGTVTALQGGMLEGDSSATISYAFAQTSQQQRDLAAVLAIVPDVVGALVILVPVLMVLAIIRGGA